MRGTVLLTGTTVSLNDWWIKRKKKYLAGLVHGETQLVNFYQMRVLEQNFVGQLFQLPNFHLAWFISRVAVTQGGIHRLLWHGWPLFCRECCEGLCFVYLELPRHRGKMIKKKKEVSDICLLSTAVETTDLWTFSTFSVAPIETNLLCDLRATTWERGLVHTTGIMYGGTLYYYFFLTSHYCDLN